MTKEEHPVTSWVGCLLCRETTMIPIKTSSKHLDKEKKIN